MLQVDEVASQDPTMISLQDLLKTGDLAGKTSRNNTRRPETMGRLARRLASERVLMEYAQLLKRELPIRLAHRIQDLEQVPHLCKMPTVQTVKQIYIDSFSRILETPDPTSPEEEAVFGNLLNDLYRNHSDVLLQMAQGAWEFKSQLKSGNIPSGKILDDNVSILFAEQEECHSFLNRFYASRVGIRVLAGQYLALRHQLVASLGPRMTSMDGAPPDPFSSPYIGMICQTTSPYKVVQRSIQDARRLCKAQFDGYAPVIEVRGRLDLTFPYLPTHLHYILLELLKNACRATMETHHAPYRRSLGTSKFLQNRKQSQLQKGVSVPPVVVIIADHANNEDVSIKISDEGGGIPRSQVEHIWSYLYTTANPEIQESFLKQQKDRRQLGQESSARADHGDAPILAGLGYGLPMSRAYARYFGGDLDVQSMEGYGTDVSFGSLV